MRHLGTVYRKWQEFVINQKNEKWEQSIKGHKLAFSFPSQEQD